ncbi:helicase-related protein [Mycobacterium sp. URHB0021]
MPRDNRSAAKCPRPVVATLLIRAATVERAKELAALYGELGIDVTVLTAHGMTSQQRASTVAKLRAGEIGAVAVGDMLGKGFDLPRLRVAVYHDKHKPTTAIVRLIGRLARVDLAFPQDSVIVSPRDVDIYPQLHGVVRRLCEEDAIAACGSRVRRRGCVQTNHIMRG